MPKISSYPDGGAVQATDQFVIARAGHNKSISGSNVGGGAPPTTTAANDFQVGDGSGNWVKKTLAQVQAILGGGFSTKIALASPASNIDFTSIVQTSSCLELRYYLRSTRVLEVDSLYVRLNNDSSNLFDSAEWYAFNSAPYGWYQIVAQNSFESSGMPAASATAGYFGTGTIWINNYSGSVGWKMIQVRGVYQSNVTGDGLGIYDTFGTYKSTSPITRVTLFPSTGPNFDTGSMAVLLGSG